MKRIVLFSLLLGLAACYCAGNAKAAGGEYELILRALHTPVSHCTLEQGSVQTPPYIEQKKGGYFCVAEATDFQATFLELAEPGWGMEWVRACTQAEVRCQTEVLPRPVNRMVDLMRYNALRLEDWAREAEQAANTDAGATYYSVMKERYMQALSACKKAKRTKHEMLIWVGRVVKDKVAFSAVSSTSGFADCFQKQLAAAIVPVAPTSPYYFRLGGYPVMFVWDTDAE